MDLRLERFQGQAEKLTKLPRAQRLALLAGVALLIVGLYAYLLFLPARQRLQTVEAEELRLQRELSQVRAVVTNLDAFEREIADLERQFAAALRRLPDSKELPVLLTDISSIAKNAGLELKTFNPGSEERQDFYAEVPIQVEFSGRFHDIASFFDRIAKLPRIVNVQTLEVKTVQESTVDTRLRVRGEAVTFRFLEAAATPEKGPKAKGGRA